MFAQPPWMQIPWIQTPRMKTPGSRPLPGCRPLPCEQNDCQTGVKPSETSFVGSKKLDSGAGVSSSDPPLETAETCVLLETLRNNIRNVKSILKKTYTRNYILTYFRNLEGNSGRSGISQMRWGPQSWVRGPSIYLLFGKMFCRNWMKIKEIELPLGPQNLWIGQWGRPRIIDSMQPSSVTSSYRQIWLPIEKWALLYQALLGCLLTK